MKKIAVKKIIIPVVILLCLALAYFIAVDAGAIAPVHKTLFAKISPRPSMQEALRPSLEWADLRCRLEVDNQLRVIDQLFENAKRGTPKFAEDALGFWSKWYYLTSEKKFKKYMNERFAHHVFSPDRLKETLLQSVQGYMTSVAETESLMVARMSACVVDLGTFRYSFQGEQAFQRIYDQALEDVQRCVGNDLAADFGKQVATYVCTEVAEMIIARVLARVSASGTIMAAGASTSWASFGLTMLVSFIVDQIVGWVWDWLADPKGKLSEHLNQKLDDMHKAIMDGDGTNPGLQTILVQMAKNRSLIRHQATTLAILSIDTKRP